MKCENCIHNPVCDHNRFGFENCGCFKLDKKSKEAKREYQKHYAKRKYAERKANHQCLGCGCKLPEDAETLKCQVCRAIASYSSKSYYKRKKKGTTTPK